jgi:arylsulfatase
MPDLANWDPAEDVWQLFDTRSDYSLMNDLASEHPEKLERLKALFMWEAEENKALPIGGALYTGINPQEMKRSSNTEWTLFEGMTRIPESQAPNVRNGNLRAEISAQVPDKVNGVIFAMGGYAGGVSLYALDGVLYYEYSALLLKRDTIEVGRLPAGDVTIAFEMRTPLQRAAPAQLKFWINGTEAATGTVQRTVPAVFTASETFDVGMDTGSPVANNYFDMAPFEFEGTLTRLHFANLEQKPPKVDKGNQTEGGEDAVVIGDLASSRPCEEGFVWERKQLGGPPMTFTTDSTGRAWLFVGTDSGFESRSAVYCSGFTAQFELM